MSDKSNSFFKAVGKVVAGAVGVAVLFQLFAMYTNSTYRQPEIDRVQDQRIDNMENVFEDWCVYQKQRNSKVDSLLINQSEMMDRDREMLEGVIENQKIIYHRMDNIPHDIKNIMDNNVVLKAIEDNNYNWQ